MQSLRVRTECFLLWKQELARHLLHFRLYGDYGKLSSPPGRRRANGWRTSIKVLKAQDGTISEFDGSLWDGMAEFVTVCRDRAITVTFRDGTEIQAS